MVLKRVCLKDIADALNVSVSTVSRALRNQPGVNPGLREQVFKMAQELNYPFKLPKEISSKRVAIIVPDISNPFFAVVCYGIESVLRSNGYLASLINTDEDWVLERDYIYTLVNDTLVDGLIAAPSANSEGVYREIIGSVPVVFFDRFYESLAVPSVVIDNKDIVFRATQYLVEMGHRSICFVSGNEAIHTGKSRTDGFKEAIKLLGLDPGRCSIVQGHFKEPEAYEATKKALKSNDFTAVIASSNKTTLGVMRALRDANLSIPADVSVIGFDNHDWMEISNPPITTVEQPATTMGILAASLLLQQIQGTSSPEKVVLKAEIKKRQSVGRVDGRKSRAAQRRNKAANIS
jgi:LacI family transcriptional regulator